MSYEMSANIYRVNSKADDLKVHVHTFSRDYLLFLIVTIAISYLRVMATQWISSLAPPPGEEPDFVNPENERAGNIALHTVCLTLATAAVAMRLYTRTFIIRGNLGVDDCFCIISYCLTVTFSALMIESYTWGIGRHMWDEPSAWLSTALKYFTIAQYFNILLTGTIKLSFLFFYYRIFIPQTRMKALITGGIIFVVLTNVTLLFLTIFSCKPISHAWNDSGKGKCWNPVILPYFSGALSVSTDIYLLVLPMRPLWKLQMNLRRKIRLLAVFGLGMFACVASIVRLAETHILTSSPDATRNISRIAIWGYVKIPYTTNSEPKSESFSGLEAPANGAFYRTIEVNTGIIVSCLQLFPKFVESQFSNGFLSSFSKIWNSGTSNRNSTKSSYVPSKEDQHTPNTQPWEGWDGAYIEMASQEALHNTYPFG